MILNFLHPIDPTFKDLKPNTKKQERKKELLKEQSVKLMENEKQIKEKASFYDIFELQGTAHKDL